MASPFLFRRLKVEWPQIHRIEHPVVLPVKGDPHKASALLILPLDLQFDGPFREFYARDPRKAIVWRGIEEDGLWRTSLRLIECPIEHFDLIGLGKLAQVVVGARCQCRHEDSSGEQDGCWFHKVLLVIGWIFDVIARATSPPKR